MRSAFEAQRGLVPLSHQVHLWCTPTNSLTALPEGKDIWVTNRMGFDILAMGDTTAPLKDRPPGTFSVGIPALQLTENGALTHSGQMRCDLMRIKHNVDTLFRKMIERTPDDLNYRAAAPVDELEWSIAV